MVLCLGQCVLLKLLNIVTRIKFHELKTHITEGQRNPILGQNKITVGRYCERY